MWSIARIPYGFAVYKTGGILILSHHRPQLFTHPCRARPEGTSTILVAMEAANPNPSNKTAISSFPEQSSPVELKKEATRIPKRMFHKRVERQAYLTAAVVSTIGITSMAAATVYYRFAMQIKGDDVLFSEIVGVFALCVGAAVGMEFWARWAHRALWHSSLWYMHESHHRPRNGPFELNDIFAIINAGPAISLLSYGFFHRGLASGLCFGAGLGITLFGIAYMFVHDGLVHRRFPVGPFADVPYFRRVAAAHQIHHADKFHGVPYGLFLGPKELEEIGASKELEREVNRRIKFQDK